MQESILQAANRRISCVLDGLEQVIFELVEAADTKSAAVGQAWRHWFSGKAANYEQDLMAAVLAVTTEQALTALRTHLIP